MIPVTADSRQYLVSGTLICDVRCSFHLLRSPGISQEYLVELARVRVGASPKYTNEFEIEYRICMQDPCFEILEKMLKANKNPELFRPSPFLGAQ